MQRQFMKDISENYFMLLKRLENYVHYCLRCLHRCGIHPNPTDFAFLTLQRSNGTIAEAVVYPVEAVKDNEIKNAMFFYGFKFDYNFSNLDYPIMVTFSEDINELIK